MKSKTKVQHKEITEIITPESSIIEEIEALELTANVNLFDAILHLCERRGLEIEQVVPIIKANQKFKKRLTVLAKELHILKG